MQEESIPLKPLFLCLSFVLMHFLSFAQQELDSLFDALRKHPKVDSTHIEIMSNIANIYSDKNLNLSIKYFKKALDLAITHKLPEQRIAQLNGNIGQSYTSLGNIELALKYSFEAAKKSLACKDSVGYFYALNNIANVYVQTNQLDKAEEFMRKESTFFPVVRAAIYKQMHYFTWGNVYALTGKYDSALQAFHECLKISETIKDYSVFQNTAECIGQCYADLKQLDSAEYYYKKSVHVVKVGQGTTAAVVYGYAHLGDFYSSLNQYDKAKRMLDSAMFFATQADNIALVREINLSLSHYYKQIGNDKLYAQHLERYYAIRDSLSNTSKQNEWNEIEAGFNQEMNEIKLLSEQKDKRLYFILSCVLLLSSLGFLYFWYKTRLKNKLLAKQKNEIELQRNEIEIQKEELIQLNQTKDKLFRIISHDLRNPLVALSNFVELQENTEFVSSEKLKIKQDTSQALSQTIALLDNLLTWAYTQIQPKPAEQTRIELDELLPELLLLVKPQADQKKVTIHLEIQQEADLVISDKHILSIILRNLLTNAIKFSYEDNLIEIKTIKEHQYVLLQIQDYGIGMNAEKLNQIKNRKSQSESGTAQEKGSGLGLTIVFDLLDKLQLPMEIRSEVGKGTKITLRLMAF